jgi:Asp-tRNA(Asn)/Glu-tRNA(Gln) amidotransferase B subunit
MPDPDIQPLNLDDVIINDIKSKMPRLPAQIREILN